MSGRSGHWLLVVATALAVKSPATWAQSDGRTAVLEEVRVVAQKREESLQDAPISIKAFDNEQLENLGIEGLGDLTGKVPNLSLSSFPADATALRVFIRGIGINDVQISQDAGVGVYLDGVYIARSTGLTLDLADIASMEVMRGPQGTLFGRNAIGGALNIHTAKPDLEELSFRQDLTLGDRDLFTSRSIINVPVTDTFAAKAIYFHSEQDGYVNNQGSGGDFYDNDNDGYRIDLRWEPTDALTVDYAYDYSDSDTVAAMPQAIREPLDSDPLFGPNALFPLSPETILYTDEEPANRLPTIAPLRDTEVETEGHALTLTWEAGDTIIKSITAYRELNSDVYTDLSRSAGILDNGEFFLLATTALDASFTGFNLFGLNGPQSFPTTTIDLEQDQFSQELQVIGSATEQLDYIVGAYYFTESADEERPLSRITSSFNAAIPGIGRTDVLREEDRDIDNEAWALYSQLQFRPDILEERLSFTLGLRYTEDTREASNVVRQDTFLSDGMGGAAESLASLGLADISGQSGLIFVDGDADETFDNFSYDFTVGYDFSDELNGYAKVATGYKSGGFNIREIVTEQFEDGFDEEDITTYELGVKSELFDRRVRLNGALFYSDYDDIQLNLAIPPGEVVGEITLPGGTYDVNANVTDTNVINAGTAEIWGVELDITAVPAAGWLLSASYAYLDTKFTDINDPRPFADPDADFVFNSAPEHTYNLNAQYTFEPFSFGELSASVNYGYTDDRYANNDTSFDDNARIDSFGLLDARLQLANIGLGEFGELRVAAWGKNLTDEEYLTDAVTTIPGSRRSVWFGEPLSYGMDLVYEFY